MSMGIIPITLKDLRLYSFTTVGNKHFGKVLKSFGQDSEPGTFGDIIFAMLAVKISKFEIVNFLEISFGFCIYY